MAANATATVRNCHLRPRNRVPSWKNLNRLRMFPALRPLQAGAIGILGPLSRKKHRKRSIPVITDRSSKLTQATTLRKIIARNAATAFFETWIFKYRPPETLLSDNGTQSALRLFQIVGQLMGLHNYFTSAHHPQTSRQVEWYNQTLFSVLRYYVNEPQNDWETYLFALTNA